MSDQNYIKAEKYVWRHILDYKKAKIRIPYFDLELDFVSTSKFENTLQNVFKLDIEFNQKSYSLFSHYYIMDIDFDFVSTSYNFEDLDEIEIIPLVFNSFENTSSRPVPSIFIDGSFNSISKPYISFSDFSDVSFYQSSKSKLSVIFDNVSDLDKLYKSTSHVETNYTFIQNILYQYEFNGTSHIEEDIAEGA